MALRERRRRCGIEAGAVVANGELRPAVVYRSGDPHLRRAAVVHAVEDQLPDDAKDCVRRVVRQARPWHIDAQRQLHSPQVRQQRLAYRVVHAACFKRPIAQVPQAVPQFVAA